MRIHQPLCIAILCLISWTIPLRILQAQSLESFIVNEMYNQSIPGLAACVVKDGRLAWMQSFGMADMSAIEAVTDSTSFLLASISKLFTATAAAQLVEEGVLNWDDPVNDHLPFSVESPSHPSVPITIRMLATHTAGIRDNWPVLNLFYNDNGDPAEPLSSCVSNYFQLSGSYYDAANNFFPYEPGTAFNYANMGFALLGYIVETAGAAPFDDQCQSGIFEEICMNESAWFLADLNESQVAHPHINSGGTMVPIDHFGFCDYPDGQLRASIRDLAHFMITVLQDGTLADRQILESATLQDMLTVQFPTVDATQGLGWYTDIFGGQSVWGHNGGETGTSTDLYLIPDQSLGVAVLCNSSSWNVPIVDELISYALGLPSGSGVALACGTAASPVQEVSEIDLMLFPNPAAEYVLISTRPGSIVILQDQTGRTLKTLKINARHHKLDLSDLNPGIYILSEIRSETGRTIRQTRLLSVVD